MLLLALWLWDSCPSNPAATWRVESAHIYQIGTMPYIDEDGNVSQMPVYSPWAETLVQEGAALQATVDCEPAAGELCAVRVTGVDEAGNVDDGSECS